ncbi:MAG: dephospho-CoA kinase [Chloroflexia bacterium]|nr:dephospho-CoA kinase [Chloroflexia bacterium]
MSVPDFVLGVTGNIATGKSTVTAMLAELGATVIDSDLVYRELVGPGRSLVGELAARFGEDIVAADGSLNRPALGKIVFSDSDALADLDRIAHPAVIAEVDRRIAGINSGVVVLDAVKLIESGHADRCDAVWLVVADPDVQVTRLMKRNRLPELEARRRVASQPPLEAKLARSDRVIDNSGSRDELREHVERAWLVIQVHDSTATGSQ